MEKKRILVVDDEVGFTRMVRLNLEQTGTYEVKEVNEGKAALATARTFRPDLILLDVVMPDMDGGDVAASIQQDPILKKVPVIFVTAVVRKREAGSAGMVSGGALFLAKPIGVVELIEAIESALGKPNAGA
ncbi:MAG: response regulator [Verrucomicrobia bacterium]|nr:response regulator [Verrucomicrobiota bacterium]